MRDFATDWNHAIARAVFQCAQCGEVAARVALVLDDADAEGSGGATSVLITESGFFGDWSQFVYRAGLQPVAEALVRQDAATLYEIEPLWAPFYCSECRACYCNRRWQMRVVFDEEWPTWYDYTEGICPSGHRRMVDD